MIIIYCPKCGCEVYDMEYQNQDKFAYTNFSKPSFFDVPPHFRCQCQRCKYKFKADSSGKPIEDMLKFIKDHSQLGTWG